MSLLAARAHRAVFFVSLFIASVAMAGALPSAAHAAAGDIKVTATREAGFGALVGATVEVQCTGGIYTKLTGNPTTDGSGVVQAQPAEGSSCDDEDSMNVRVTKTGYTQTMYVVTYFSAGDPDDVFEPANAFIFSNIQFGLKVAVRDELNIALSGATVTAGTSYSTNCLEGGTDGSYQLYYCPTPAGAGVGTSLSVFKDGFIWEPDASGAYTKRTSNGAAQSTANITVQYGHVIAADYNDLTITADTDIDGGPTVTCLQSNYGSISTDNDGDIYGFLYYCAIPTGDGNSSIRVERADSQTRDYYVDRRDNPTDDRYGLDIYGVYDYSDPNHWDGLHVYVQDELGEDSHDGATVTYDGHTCNSWWGSGDFFCPAIDGSGTVTVSQDGYVSTTTVGYSTSSGGSQVDAGTVSLKFAYKITDVTSEIFGTSLSSDLLDLSVGNNTGRDTCIHNDDGAWYCPVATARSDGTLVGYVSKDGYVADTYNLVTGTQRDSGDDAQVSDTIAGVKYAYKLSTFQSEGNSASVSPSMVTMNGDDCSEDSGAWYCAPSISSTEDTAVAVITAPGYVTLSAYLTTRGSQLDGQVTDSIGGIEYQVKVSVADELGNAMTAGDIAFDGNVPDYIDGTDYYFARIGNESQLSIQKSGFIPAGNTNNALNNVFTDPSQQLAVTMGNNEPDMDGSLNGTENIKGLEYTLHSGTLRSEVGGDISDIEDGVAAVMGGGTVCSPSDDASISTYNGLIVMQCATMNDEIYAAVVGDGGVSDDFTVTLSNVTADGGMENGADLAIAGLSDDGGTISGAPLPVSFCVGTGCLADISNDTGFRYPLKVEVRDEFGSAVDVSSLDAKTFNGVDAYYTDTGSQTLYFGNVASSANLRITRFGFVPAYTTNGAFAAQVSADQTGQTYIAMGDTGAVVGPINATASQGVRGLEYKLKSDLLNDELGNTISGTDNGDIFVQGGAGTTVVGYIAHAGVIYIAAYGDGEGDDLKIALSGVTAGGGSAEGASFIYKSLAGSALDSALGDQDAGQRTFDVSADGESDIVTGGGFQYPLVIAVNTELGEAVTDGTLSFDSVEPYMLDDNNYYFGNLASDAVLHVGKEGFVDLETTNSMLSHTTTNLNGQVVLYMDGNHGTFGYPDFSLDSRYASWTVHGLEYSQLVRLRDANGDGINGGMVSVGTDPTTICTVVGSFAYCPVPSSSDPDTFTITATVPGFASNTSHQTVARSSSFVSHGVVDVDDFGYPLQVTAIFDEKGNNIMPEDGTPFSLTGGGVVSQTYDSYAGVWNIAAADSADETLSVSVPGYVTRTVHVAIGDGQKTVSFGGDGADYNGDALRFPLVVYTADDRGYNTQADSVTFGEREGVIDGISTYFTSDGETSDIVAAKDGYVTQIVNKTVDRTTQSGESVTLPYALRVRVYDGDSNSDRVTGATVMVGSEYSITCIEGVDADEGIYFCPVGVEEQTGGIGKVQMSGYTTRTFTYSTREDDADPQVVQDIHIYGSSDSSAPTVQSTYPTGGDDELPITTHPYVTFSEAMDPSTLTAENIKLCRSTDEFCTDPVGATVNVVDGDTSTARILPEGPLDYSSGYWIQVGTGVTDVAGNHLATAFSSSEFLTVGPNAPIVSGQTPVYGSIAVTGHPYVDFSRVMDATTVNSDSVMICLNSDPACESSVPADVVLSEGGTRAIIIPSSPLQYDFDYWILVTTAVRSAEGIALAATYGGSFDTEGSSWFTTYEADVPYVTAQYPAALTTDVPVAVHPYLDFNLALDPATVTNGTVFLCSADDTSCEAPISAAVALTNGGTRVLFIPDSALSYATPYWIKVTTNVHSSEGVSAAETSYVGEAAFITVGDTADHTSPTVTSVSPTNTQDNLSTLVRPTITFSEPMSISSLTESYVKLYVWGGEGGEVPVTIYASNGNRTVTIVPNAPLDPDTAYLFEASYLMQDVAGNALGYNSQTIFFTAPLSVPTVISQTPDIGATDVGAEVHPSVSFSAAMDPRTVTSAVFLCAQSDTTCESPIDTDAALSDGGTLVTLTPSVNLDYDTRYWIFVDTTATDLAGTALAEAYGSQSDSFRIVDAAGPSLAIADVSLVRSVATKDNTFNNGWRWDVSVTVPDIEPAFQMSFDDFAGPGALPAANNIRFYSAQFSDANTADNAIIISSAGAGSAWSTAATVDDDLDGATPGRQILVTLETKVPVETADGSYSTSFGIQTSVSMSPFSLSPSDTSGNSSDESSDESSGDSSDDSSGDGEPSALSVSVSAPNGSVSAWAPVVDWGSAATCEYSFDGTTYASADCSADGADIPAPASGAGTLSARATDANGGSVTASSAFDYEPVTDAPPPIEELRPVDDGGTESGAGEGAEA